MTHLSNPDEHCFLLHLRFTDYYKSLDERLKEHSISIIENGKKLEQIKRNQQNINKHSRILDRMNKKVTKLLDINDIWMISKQMANKNSNGKSHSKSRIQNPPCPDCGIVMRKSGKTSLGQQRYHCHKQKNGCGKCWYDIGDGKLIYGYEGRKR